MPEIGEIRKAKESGKTGTGKYIWHACLDCGKEQWVQLRRRKPESVRCRRCCQFGNRSSRWKGGRVNHLGYVFIHLKEDDFFYSMANKQGYAFEHRLVVARSLERCLHSWELVHHKNHIRDDNKLENLQLVSDDRHIQITILENKINQLLQKQDDLMKEIRLLRLENKQLLEVG